MDSRVLEAQHVMALAILAALEDEDVPVARVHHMLADAELPRVDSTSFLVVPSASVLRQEADDAAARVADMLEAGGRDDLRHVPDFMHAVHLRIRIKEGREVCELRCLRECWCSGGCVCAGVGWRGSQRRAAISPPAATSSCAL
ncbi:MAG: hypothetical protein EOO41_01435 [Methanobacteriota archaeon]|nr:MAG: hypothetical protein EOO41_01435 [Euryarchaeota archaeon]